MKNQAKPERPGRSWVGLIISIISLCLAAIALWYSTLRPADVKAEVSPPVFLWRQGLETPVSSTEQPKPKLLIYAVCTFSNNGAQIGRISRLALRFESDDGTRWLFYPYWVVDDTKFLADGFEKRTWINGPFHSILVPGKQTLTHSYMFLAESGLPRFQDATLTPHKFRVTLLTWSSNEVKPHEQQTSMLDFDADLIDKVSKGATFGMPFSEQQKQVQSVQ